LALASEAIRIDPALIILHIFQNLFLKT